MGQYRIEITAVGGHGCQREIKDGGTTYGCGRIGCPDCEAREFVRRLQSKGQSIESATLTHWPGQVSEVTDNLLSGERKGSF
jgi:hypothetical protein